MQKNSKRIFLIQTILLLLNTVFFTPRGFATSGTWTGAGADANFTTAANWSASPAPTNSSDIATFDGTGNNTKAAAITINMQIGGSTIGSSLSVASGQTTAVRFIGIGTSQFWRLNQGSTITLAAGAGPLSFDGASSSALMRFVVGGGGLSSASSHTIINNNPSGGNAITFGTNSFFGPGGTAARTNVFDGSGDIIVNGRLIGTLRVVKSGFGTLTLAGDNATGNSTVAGPMSSFTLNTGTLNINHARALGTNTSTFIINGGTIDNTSGADISIAYPISEVWNNDFTFSGTGNLNLGTGAVTLTTTPTVTVNGGTLTIGGAISGTGFGLNKAGVGTLVLTGSGFYNGNTTISGGTLRGNAQVASKAIVNNGGTLWPGAGNPMDTLTILSNLVLNAGSTTTFDVNGSTSAHETINVGGSISYGGVLNLVTSGTFTIGQRFTLFTGSGATNTSNFDSIQHDFISGVEFAFTNGVLSVVSGPIFLHPGGLHTMADFLRMSNKVATVASPWIDSYNQLTNISLAKTNWPWAPAGQIFRCGSGCANNYSRSQKDALAIYYLALRYWITGDANYANYAIQGMDKWSSKMTNGVGGDSNWALGAGLCGYEFAVAGEALRGYPGWSQTSISNYCNFLMLFELGNHAFLAGHNNACDSHYWANWDACNLASMIAIGVFCDNTNIFNEAVTYYKQGIGCGNITSAAWFIHTNGLAQWEESGRDQAHTMDGIAWLAVACQVAGNQGVDLYGFDNNRFLRGVEYAAKYNLGYDVPYLSFHTCDASEDFGTTNLDSTSRGFLPPTWDMMFNHYVNVKGMDAPYTAQAAVQNRPDGFYNNANSPDFVGFSTLTCLQDPIPTGVPPSGLTVIVSGPQVSLNWFGTTYATNYSIKRATVHGGPYTTIGTVSSANDRVFVDTTVTNGGTYYYTISALTPSGESANSQEAAATILAQLVAYYKFDETNGTTAADSSGFGRPPATLVNGATFIAGKSGNAVSLNGSSQYVQLPYGIIAGLRDFTLATWVYINSVATSASLFDFGADVNRYMYLVPNSNSGKLAYGITKFGGSGGGGEILSGTQVASGGWHHVALTLQGGGGFGVTTLYLDGVPVGTLTNSSYYPDMIGGLINATNNWIGKAHSSSYPYLNGKVDEVRIYNGALSATQIASLAAGGGFASPQASVATIGPVSLQPVQLEVHMSGDQLQFAWPTDHTGWQLQMQTNNLSGFGTNWVTIPGSALTNQMSLPVNPTAPCVFFRMIYLQ